MLSTRLSLLVLLLDELKRGSVGWGRYKWEEEGEAAGFQCPVGVNGVVWPE